MFAQRWVYLHTPPLLGRKFLEAKSRISLTSKLIETKGLQVHYFGHLRKTGGRGSYQLVQVARVGGRFNSQNLLGGLPFRFWFARRRGEWVGHSSLVV
jgi:hypothetical protein